MKDTIPPPTPSSATAEGWRDVCAEGGKAEVEADSVTDRSRSLQRLVRRIGIELRQLPGVACRIQEGGLWVESLQGSLFIHFSGSIESPEFNSVLVVSRTKPRWWAGDDSSWNYLTTGTSEARATAEK